VGVENEGEIVDYFKLSKRVIHMRQFAIVVTTILIPTFNAFGWFSTTLDTVEVRYPSGQLKEQFQTAFFEGSGRTAKFGFYWSWYENGQMEWSGHYAENDKVGCWVNWDSTGFLLAETSYDNGLKNGTEIEWNPDGTFRKLLYYKNDSLNGLCTWGKPGIMINGFYNTPDLIIDSQSYYLDGKLIVKLWKLHDSTSYFSMSGPQRLNYNNELNLWFECKRLEPSISTYNNNASIFIGRKVGGKREGMWIQYNRSGNVIKAEYYENGELKESK